MDRCKWRKMIKDVRWSGWVWVGECFFRYWPTRVVPDKRPLNCCVCVCVYLYGEWWCISPSIYLAAVALYFELLLVHSFNGLFFRTTWASQYQKGKTSMDLNEARDDGVLGCSGISWTICTQSAPHSRQFTTPTPPLFLQVGCSAWCLTNNVKALKHNTNGHTVF